MELVVQWPQHYAGLAKSLDIKEAFRNAHFYVNQAIITSPIRYWTWSNKSFFNIN